MQRYGSVIRLKPEVLEEYKKYHAEPWPKVLEMIHKCNIRNYSIFHKDGWLFGYYEYIGEDHAADMEKMAQDPHTRKWWDIMGPMQIPLETRGPDDNWWAAMEEVFHTD